MSPAPLSTRDLKDALAFVEPAAADLPFAPRSLHVSTRQIEVLREISKACATGVPPTVRELAKALGIGSTNGVKDHLKALESKGLISVQSQKARAIRVTEGGLELVGKFGGTR